MSSNPRDIGRGAYEGASQEAPVGSNHLYAGLALAQGQDFIHTYGLYVDGPAGAPFLNSVNFIAYEERSILVSGNWMKWIGYGSNLPYNMAFQFYLNKAPVSDLLALSVPSADISEKFVLTFDEIRIRSFNNVAVGVSFAYGKSASGFGIRT